MTETTNPIINSNNRSSLSSYTAVDNEGPPGCYLVYEPSSSGRLMLYYSQGPVPTNAVGFWLPGEGQMIQGFKFKQNGGRQELIKGIAGGDANKRRYFTGWCQFLKLAKAKHGRVIQFTPETQGLPVDVYGYHQADSSCKILDCNEGLLDLQDVDAVAVMARNHEFLKGVKTIGMNSFMDLGNIAGATTSL
jgi:hypothetical protein